LPERDRGELLKSALKYGWSVVDLSIAMADRINMDRRNREAMRLVDQLGRVTERREIVEIDTRDETGLGLFGDFDFEFGARILKVRVVLTRYLDEGDDPEPMVDVQGLAQAMTKSGKAHATKNAIWISLPNALAEPILGKLALR
jgi:hypothetical protein